MLDVNFIDLKTLEGGMEKRVPPRFLCDEMLKKLAKWLRIMGYDVTDPSVENDQELIGISNKEGRTILTRDKDLSNNRSSKAIRIISDDLDSQIKEVLDRFPLEDFPPGPTRCSVCNGELMKHPSGSIMVTGNEGDPVPEDVKRDHKFVYICNDCNKVFWTGSHWIGITSRLSSFGMAPTLPN